MQAPGENKGSRGPSPAPQRETPSPITDSDGAVIESAKLNAVAREAAKRAQLRNCVLACVAGNNWRVQKKITMAVQQYFREAKKNGSAPGESIVEGVVKEVTQSGKYGYFLKQKAREELINKVLPELSTAKPSTPPSGLAKAVKQAKKPKTSPKTQPIPASDSKAKRQKGPSDESAKDTTAAVVKKHKGHNDEPMKDRTEAKAKRPKPFPDNNASGPSEPKPKKHKSLTAAPKASAGGPGSKAPRQEKQPVRGPAHGSPDAQKPPPTASGTAAKASAHAQPKARSDARHAADVATPRATPPVRTPPAATPKPAVAPKPRTAARPAAPPAAPAQPASARSTPASPADTPMETLPEAPPVRTVRQSSPAPPKVPAEVLMDQYPPKVSADVLEGIADDTPRPAPAWCEPADEGADAEAEMHCDAGAEPASPGSNESEPRHDSEMRGGGADGGEAAARRRTTRGQRAPNYCEDSDDDFAIDTTPVARAVAPTAQAAHPAGAAPGAGAYGMAEADAGFRHAAAEDEGPQAARDADMAQLRSSESPPTQFGEVAADKGGAAWAQPAEPPVPLRDSSWFREHAEAAGEMRMGRAVPALTQAQVPQAYETYRTLAAEVQGQMEAMEAITGLGDSKPLSAEQERALHEFQVNQQYWEDAYMTLTALHERLGQARLQGVH